MGNGQCQLPALNLTVVLTAISSSVTLEVPLGLCDLG